MSARHPPDLHDADPTAWQGDKKPDPSAAEAAVLLAAKTFARLDDRLREYAGARSGHAYEKLLAEWRASRTALVNAARANPGEAT